VNGGAGVSADAAAKTTPDDARHAVRDEAAKNGTTFYVDPMQNWFRQLYETAQVLGSRRTRKSRT
jgi:hypothetical protein